MTDTVDTLLVDVRASTQGFAQDIAEMRGAFDGTLVDGFSRAGDVLERGLLGAIKRGSLGFEDLRRTALNVIDSITAQSLRGVLGGIGHTPDGGISGLLGIGSSLIGSILGLPGRATGGSVAPGRGYLVGERGPELFIPTSAGRVEPNGANSAPRQVSVSITLNAPAGTSPTQGLQRSSRQIASAVRRALREN